MRVRIALLVPVLQKQLIQLMGNSTREPLHISTDSTLQSAGDTIGLAGWGIAEGTNGEASPVLRYTEMKVL